MIDNGATQIELFDTINQIVDLNLSKEIISEIIRMFESNHEKYPNCVASLNWANGQFGKALQVWSELSNGQITDATYQGLFSIKHNNSN